MAYLTFARVELGKESFKFSEQFDYFGFCSELLKNQTKRETDSIHSLVFHNSVLSSPNANILFIKRSRH
jgi:hypothetical protein